MKRTTRAIILEILPLFLMGNFFFVFILILEQMVQLTDFLIVRSIPFIMIAQTIVHYIPSFLVITIPISVLLAAFLAFSRFSADSEIVAMQACGASGFSFLKPVLAFGIAAALAGIYFSTVLLPKGSMLALDNLNKMLENLSVNDIREKEMYTDINGIIFYANKKISSADFEEVIMIDNNQKAIISSKNGAIYPSANRSLLMQFDDGRVTMTDKNQTYTNLTFGKLTVNLPVNLSIKQFPINERLMSLADLRKNFSSAPIYRYEYWKRFSMPVSAIIMSLLGFSVGISLQRSGRSLGIVISCAIALTFNVLFIVGENFVGKYSSVVLAWMPVIVFSAILMPVLRRVMR